VLAALASIATIVAASVGTWLKLTDRPSNGPPNFEGAAGSIDEIADFDGFITDHTGERVHVSATFPNNSTIRQVKGRTPSEGGIRRRGRALRPFQGGLL
jgi:hypothetical protein